MASSSATGSREGATSGAASASARETTSTASASAASASASAQGASSSGSSGATASGGGSSGGTEQADKNVEIWKIKRLIKSLEAARGYSFWLLVFGPFRRSFSSRFPF